MSQIAVSNNTINWTVSKGTSFEIVINKSTGWAMYDEIKMDFKYLKEVNSPSFLTLTVGGGFVIDGNRLIGSVSYAQSLLFSNEIIHADIKLRIGREVLEPIPFLINVKDTVTHL